jgi:hypothetical protein
MRLLDLEPEFLRYEMAGPYADSYIPVDSIQMAQGVQFLCPKCFVEKGGKEGVHLVRCWAPDRGVPEHLTPKPGRWRLVGTGLHDLSLVAEPTSIQLLAGCRWHGVVRDGLVLGA